MVGCQKYTDEQITFILNLYAKGVSRPEISELYAERFDRPDYTHKKVQYVIDQFGKHPKYSILKNRVLPSKMRKIIHLADTSTPVVEIKEEPLSPGPGTPQDEPVEGIRKMKDTKKALCEACNGTGVVPLKPPKTGDGSGHGQTGCLVTHASRALQATGPDDSPDVSRLHTPSPAKGRQRSNSNPKSPGAEDTSPSRLPDVSPHITGSTNDTENNGNTDNTYTDSFWESVLSYDQPFATTESYHMPTAYDTMSPVDFAHPTTASEDDLAALPPHSFHIGDYEFPSWSEFPDTSPALSLKRSYEEFQSPSPWAGLAPTAALDPHISPMSWMPAPLVPLFEHSPRASADVPALSAGSSYGSSGSGSDAAAASTFPPEPSTGMTIPHDHEYRSRTKRARLSATAAAALLQLSPSLYLSSSLPPVAPSDRVASATADPAAALPPYYAFSPTPALKPTPDPEPALKIESTGEGETDTTIATAPSPTHGICNDATLFEDMPLWEEDEITYKQEGLTPSYMAAGIDTTIGMTAGKIGDVVAGPTMTTTTTQALPYCDHQILDDDDDDDDGYPYGAITATGME
ncbi:hypothetical protein SLS62_008694 [Diatrype stigma]|uniref:Uncharacterized protein n=1 Tax=Diatrype stigma TaxID=117547 RepID=A0AAN9YL85_9PEZI